MSIYRSQNEPKNLQLLAAYSQVYLQAKRYMGIRTVISVLVTIIGTLLALLLPSAATLVGAVSALWSLISEVVLKPIEKQKVKEGATIQEEFDSNLFGLSWNSNLVGNRITPELILSADRDFRGDRNKLKNWYPDTGAAQRPVDILICQRSCVVWDWRLRRLFIMMVVGASVTWFVIEIIIALMMNLSVLNFTLALLLPSLAIFLIAFDIVRENHDLLGIRQKLDDKISKYLSSRQKKAVTVKVCREIQNDLFRLRSKGALIPNWFYFIFRDKFESDMTEVAKTLGKKS